MGILDPILFFIALNGGWIALAALPLIIWALGKLIPIAFGRRV
jgi:hypothetical protein